MRKFLALVALAALAGAVAFGWSALDRPVRVVKVEGPLSEAEAAQIRRRIGQVLQARLLTMNVVALREQVMELSWPGAVSVRKVWPDTLVVRVARRTLVARWGDLGYVTPAGEVVSSLNAPADLPIIDCALSNPDEALEVYRFLQGMAEEAGLDLSRIAENEIGEWQLAFTAPVAAGADAAGAQEAIAANAMPATLPVVKLGADRLQERMRRFLAVWPRLSERAAADYVDLRYGQGLAVRWREPGTQHAATTETTTARETT